MREKEMVEILQSTQHDLMNNLQVIQGYLSMDKIDTVKSKVANYIDYYSEKRKLLNINAPHFILWVIQFNHVHNNMELSYHIQAENVDLSKIDLQLVKDCEQIIDKVLHLGMERGLYKVNLEISHRSSNVTVIMNVVGQFVQENVINDFEQYESAYVKETENGFICKHVYTI